MSSKKDIEAAEYEFDLRAYAYIAGGDDFEILPIPDMKGEVPTPEEFRLVAFDYKKRSAKLLYRVSQGDRVVVFSLDLERVGIFPENHEHGFPC
jgi:hypothetical protein